MRQWLVVVLVAGLLTGRAAACPFCSPVGPTLSENMAESQIAVLCQLRHIEQAPAPGGTDRRGTFQIVAILKGHELLKGLAEFEATYIGSQPVGTEFFLLGVDHPRTTWSVPMAVAPRVGEYLRRLPGLPSQGSERLRFFLDYLNDADEILRKDAYDEFAKAPYADVKGLKPLLVPQTLLQRIRDSRVDSNRKRLYLTLLGTCGTRAHAAELAELLRSNDPTAQGIRDAAIGCYLTLVGREGVDLVEELFLISPQAPQSDRYAAVTALRFHGQEESMIPRDRLQTALALLLRPDDPVAVVVIADLARWQDWSHVARLAKLFDESPPERRDVRVAIVQYLLACPLAEAQRLLAQLEELDPRAVSEARLYSAAPQTPALVPPPRPPEVDQATPASPDGPDGSSATTPPAAFQLAAGASTPVQTRRGSSWKPVLLAVSAALLGLLIWTVCRKRSSAGECSGWFV
jgi:hypothetical protein